MAQTGFETFVSNLKALPQTIPAAIFRHGPPTSDRAKSQTVVSNFFLHIQSARTHRHTLKFRTTLGLGVISFVLFLLLCITGVLLMVYYKPAVDQAYGTMKDIHFVVPTGRVMRNLHRWGAHAMVASVIVHMARVFYTAAYKAPREFNWALGMILLVLTLGLSFTGYLLPWDQLAFWAITVGANIAQSPREITDALGITAVFDIGGFQKSLLLGAREVGQEALIRFYVLHVIVLPAALFGLLGVHFWRIRKDGGIARPDSGDAPRLSQTAPEGAPAFRPAPSKSYGLMALVRGRTPAVNQDVDNTVPSWPNLFYAEMAVAMLTVAVLLVLSLWIDAPLREIANPAVPENPAKAPWYFLGLQELVSYSAVMGGIGVPTIVLVGLGLIPFLDRETEGVGEWFSGPRGRRITLMSAVFAAVTCLAVLAFTVNFGWLRNWFPNIPQLVITFVNPGTLFLGIYVGYSLAVLRATNSTRMGAIAVFTCFFVSFIILTYFATVHRGPNWDFYWSQSQWPVH